MSTDDVKVRLSLEDEVSPAVQRLQADLARLQRLTRRLKTPAASSFLPSPKVARAAGLQLGQELRQRLLFGQKMQRQQQRQQRDEDRAAKTAESRALAGFKAQMAFAARMSSQRAAEERQRQSAHRDELRRLDRENAAHARVWRDRRRRALDGISSTSRGAAVAAGIGTAGAAVAGRRVLGLESTVDSAEINARIYGNLSREAARRLRTQWAVPKGMDLGTDAAGMISSYVDALKAGIPEPDAKGFAELSTKVSKAWGIQLEQVVDALGMTSAILTSDGSRFDFRKLQSSANAVQALAGGMATTPQKLLEFQRQGAGAAKLLGMSQETGLAFGAASTSLGNKAGESGTLLDFIAGRVMSMDRIARQDGEEGKQARGLMRALGYGSANAMNQRRRANPDAFVSDLLERLNRIPNAKKRDEAIRFLAGQEWLGELSRLVTGIATVRQADRIAQDSRRVDAIGAAFTLHTEKLEFIRDQVVGGFKNLVGDLGMALSSVAAEVGRFFVRVSSDWIAGGKIKQSIDAFLGGAVRGFLGRDGSLRDLLDQFHGSMTGSFDPAKFYQFGKGLAEGLLAVGSAFKSAMSGLASLVGMDPNSAATMGKLVGGIIGLSAALAILSPVVGVIGALSSALLGLAAAGVAVGGLAGLGKAASAGTAGAGAAGAAGAGAGGFSRLLRFLGLGGAAAGPALFGGTRVQPFTADQLKALGLGPDGKRLPASGEVEHTRDLFGTAGHSFMSGYSGLNTLESMNEHLEAIRSDLKLGGLSDKATSGLSNFGYGVGDASGGYGGVSSGGQLPNGMSVADLTGTTAAGGGKTLLDAIARAEGTAGRGDYNASLGYGRFLPGGKEQDLTGKTLAEVYQLGLHMRRQPGNPNSSALGRYQIVGSTMKEAAKALGLDWSTTKFDASTQDAMAQWIAKRQGLGAWEGFKRNPAELATAKAAMSGASTITAGAAGSQAGAVDVASKMLGMHENGPGRRALNSFMGSHGFNIDAARTAWCAAFVNSSLAAVGIQGNGSLTANSFLDWGQKIDPAAVLKGDVLVKHRNRGLDAQGGHVGMATGRTRIGPNGQPQTEMLSGNTSGMVGTTWENQGALAVRRALGQVPTAQGLAAGVTSAADLGARVPTPSQRPAQGSGVTQTVTNNITIQSAVKTTEELARDLTGHIKRQLTHSFHDIHYAIT